MSFWGDYKFESEHDLTTNPKQHLRDLLQKINQPNNNKHHELIMYGVGKLDIFLFNGEMNNGKFANDITELLSLPLKENFFNQKVKEKIIDCLNKPLPKEKTKLDWLIKLVFKSKESLRVIYCYAEKDFELHQVLCKRIKQCKISVGNLIEFEGGVYMSNLYLQSLKELDDQLKIIGQKHIQKAKNMKKEQFCVML